MCSVFLYYSPLNQTYPFLNTFKVRFIFSIDISMSVEIRYTGMETFE